MAFNINIKPTEKQKLAWKSLIMNEDVKYLLFGGGAGGGKTWLACEWLLIMCIKYPGTKWFIGRNELKRLMGSTYVTFQKVCKYHNIPHDFWKLNGQYNYIEFTNGSRIDLLDLAFKPSDQLYERYGSVEFTGGFIEEAGEVHFAAFDTLKSRIGRQLNKKYNILPKILLSCNPKKNWLYLKIYKPSKEGTLKEEYDFIESLYTDNPYTADSYGAALDSIEDKSKKERLKNGNWDYDDDPNVIMEYDAICDLFSNEFVKGDGDMSMSADLAMKGRDKFVAGAWDGLVCEIIIDKNKSGAKEIEMDLKSACQKYKIPRSKTIADSDGLGSYLEDYMKGIVEFHGGAKAKHPLQYFNLRSECYFKLAELVNKRKIFIKIGPGIANPEKVKLKIIEELSVIKAIKIDRDDKPKQIMKKEDIKKLLGHSPDYSDMLMMRMVREIIVKEEFHTGQSLNVRF